MTSYITCFPLTAFRGRGSREQKANKANIWHQRARTEVSPRDEPWPRGERPRGPTTHTGRYAKRSPLPAVALLPLCKVSTGQRAAECGLTKYMPRSCNFRSFFSGERSEGYATATQNFPAKNVILLILILVFNGVISEEFENILKVSIREKHDFFSGN